MKFYGIECKGKIVLQKVNGLPAYDNARDEGRVVFDTNSNRFYFGGTSDWERMTIKQELDSHINDTTNPHNVTTAQTGADTHINSTSNPHNVTPDQVGSPSDSEFDNHVNDTTNPHNVRYSQLGNHDNTYHSEYYYSHGDDATFNKVNLQNHESGDFSTGGDMWHDESAGVYIYSDNAGGEALMWDNNNVTAGSNINISTDSEGEPTIGVKDNPDFNQVYTQGVQIRPYLLLHIQDRQPNGNNGENVSSPRDWRSFNTILTDEIGGITIGSESWMFDNETTNTIQGLPEGNYHVEASAPLVNTTHKAILEIVHPTAWYSSSNWLVEGTTESAPLSENTNTNTQTRSWICGRFSLSGSEDLRIVHFNNRNAIGGISESYSNSGDEIYTEIRIWKIG